uniref:Uncharacterized protein n=1 Tax=Solanum lycopersicum TaxID=4081 RepID=A0A3Q7IXW6_SOLLC
ADYLWNS